MALTLLSSWPGLSRPSASLHVHGREDVDARVKPAQDEVSEWIKPENI
jgi:hypothetical protein